MFECTTSAPFQGITIFQLDSGLRCALPGAIFLGPFGLCWPDTGSATVSPSPYGHKRERHDNGIRIQIAGLW